MLSLVNRLEALVSCKGEAGIAGLWSDEHQLVAAAKKVREAGFTKFEAISPFPLHGIDEAMHIPRSFIPNVTFVFGLLGFAFGTWFTWWTSAVNWPIVIAGKPLWSLPAFIPVIFECTILLAALSSVAALLFVCGLPKVNPPIIDASLTSHRFALFVPMSTLGTRVAELESLMKSMGADEVRRTEF